MMFYIFLPSLGERGRLDTDNVSPEIENLIILSTSLHSTLVGALLSSKLNKLASEIKFLKEYFNVHKGAGRVQDVGLTGDSSCS